MGDAGVTEKHLERVMICEKAWELESELGGAMELEKMESREVVEASVAAFMVRWRPGLGLGLAFWCKEHEKSILTEAALHLSTGDDSMLHFHTSKFKSWNIL